MTKTTINFESDSFTDVDDTSLQALADKCKTLEKVENNIEVAESLLKELKEKARLISEEEIPQFLAEKGLSSITLDNGTEVKITEEVRPGIKVADRHFCYAWLRDNGYGDLIKNNVTVAFGMGEDAQAIKLKAAIQDLGMVGSEKEDVHYQTMKAFVTEQHKKGVSLPDEFGVYVANKTKLVQKRKI